MARIKRVPFRSTEQERKLIEARRYSNQFHRISNTCDYMSPLLERRSPRRSRSNLVLSPIYRVLEADRHVVHYSRRAGNRLEFLVSKIEPKMPRDFAWVSLPRARRLCRAALVDYLRRIRMVELGHFLMLSRKNRAVLKLVDSIKLERDA